MVYFYAGARTGVYAYLQMSRLHLDRLWYPATDGLPCTTSSIRPCSPSHNLITLNLYLTVTELSHQLQELTILEFLACVTPNTVQ